MEEKKYKQFDFLNIYIKSALVLGVIGGFFPIVILLVLKSYLHKYSEITYQIQIVIEHFFYFGWIGISLMGITIYFLMKYRDVDVLWKYMPLSTMWLMVSGVTLKGLFQVFSGNHSFATLVILGGLLEFSSVIVYSYMIYILIHSGKKRREKYEDFIITGCFWFFLAGCLNLYGIFFMVQNELLYFPPQYEKIINHILFFGFFLTTVIGISLRSIPEILGFKPVKDFLNNEILWLLTLGIFLMGYSLVREKGMPFMLSTTMEFFSIMAFIYSLNIFRKMDKARFSGEDLMFARFIRISYFWATAFIFYYIVLNYYWLITGRDIRFVYAFIRDQLCVEGALTMLIIGIFYRIMAELNNNIPYKFEGSRQVFWLLNIGVLMKIVITLIYYFHRTTGFMFLIISQLMIAVAAGIFLIDVWTTDKRKEKGEVFF
ncbi:MAG: hypothetical protein A2161_12770 [Candidatus Schekmanbacteria bacterium RBG_13_48_7]|uniref:Uncharacterized protein n=1 Tax=Candidatus Schekmanbacteria bacterium RBG_13_48_7 TaxID=1817878 RepID=A0A1F7S8G4_9BACT|nr:MAG: hypothetical protein A2161_12770 [Candidatus Schekmanbacteria bacterium RBG_13_48_7]